MRSELGKITLDKTFEERDTLNENIVKSINEAASDWGLQCLRYEIRDISPPPGVRAAMEMQAEAERRKRAQVLESEGERQAHINIADGKKNSVILESEAAMMDQVSRTLLLAHHLTIIIHPETLELSFNSMRLFVGSWSLMTFHWLFCIIISNFFPLVVHASEVVFIFSNVEQPISVQ